MPPAGDSTRSPISSTASTGSSNDAGAAGAAGVLAAREAGLIRDGESVAVMVTGHGLKDPEPALKKIRLPRPVKP